MTSDQSVPGTLHLPALGRCFTLGQLYDCRSEKILEGEKLWSNETITKTLTRHPKKSSQHTLLTNDTLENKSSILGIDGRLHLSTLCNMIPLAGSSKFLHDHKGTVALQYSCTSRFDEINIEMLKEECVQRRQVFVDGTATHVVCAILFGGQVIFSFDKSNSNACSQRDVSLHDAVLALTQFDFDDDRHLNIPDDLKEQTRDIKCQLYSDFKTPFRPTGFEDAAKLFKMLPHFVEGGGTDAVPLEVWLYPLEELDFRSAKVVCEVSPPLFSQIETTFKHFDEAIDECDALIKSIGSKPLAGITNDVREFQEILNEYTSYFQNEIKLLVARVRNGSVDGKILERVLARKENSPFSRSRIDVWIKHKYVQIKTLKLDISLGRESGQPLTKHTSNEVMSSSSQALVSSTTVLSTDGPPCLDSSPSSLPYLPSTSEPGPVLSSSSHSLPTLQTLTVCPDNDLHHGSNSPIQKDDIDVCFHVSVGGRHSLTKLMKAHLQHLKSGSLQDLTPETSLQYFVDDDSMEVLRKAEQFKNFVEANKFRENIHFSFSEDTQDDCDSQVYITIHKSGHLVDEDFRLPATPKAAKLIRATHDQIKIKWPEPEQLGQNALNYDIRLQSQSTGFTRIEQVEERNEITMSKLDVGTEYNVEVRAVCWVGSSQWSNRVVMSTLPATPPGKPTAKHKTTGVHLQWQKPDVVAREISIQGYTVTVCNVSQGKQFDVASDPRYGEEMTLYNLSPTSSFRFKVRAHLNSDQLTEDSEESEVLKPTPNALLKAELVANSKRKTDFIYQLELRYDSDNIQGKIRKCELCLATRGETIGVTEKVIMIVGATGAGKTTLINGLVNYILGVKWEDKFRFILIDDNDEATKRSQAHSQTRWITSYTLKHREGFIVPFTVTIIDTPGFGDTSGIKRDQEITDQIRTFFTTKGGEGIDHIDGIGFVVQAALARLTAPQKFIFDSVLSLFGKDISDNIFLLITFADGQPPPVLEGVKEAKLPYKSVFTFNNSALYVPTGQGKYLSNFNHKGADNKPSGNFSTLFWDMGEFNFETFFDALNQTQSKSLILTKDVLNERHSLEANVFGIHQNIRTGLNKLEQLKVESEVLRKHEADIHLSKDFTYTVNEEQVKSVDIPSGTYITNCLQCNFTCHYPCHIPDDSNKMNCAAMDSNSDCRVCPAKCVWNVHKNMTYKFEKEIIVKTKTAEDLKARYEDASGKKKTVEELIKDVVQEFEDVQMEVIFLTNKIRKNLARLKEIALKPDPLSMVEYVDILIESEKSEKNPGWNDRLQQLHEVRNRAEILERLSTGDFDPFEKCKEVYFDIRKEGTKQESIFNSVIKKIKSFVGQS